MHQQLIDSLIAELNRTSRLGAEEKALLLLNFSLSCTISAFSLFLGLQQTNRLCKENMQCSAAESAAFLIPNGISQALVAAFTSSQFFAASQRAWIGKNNAFFSEHKNSKKAFIQLTLSMLTGAMAAIPIMLSTRNPVGSKLAFIANFIMASYSFYSIAQDLLAAKSYQQPNVQLFLKNLKSYELRGQSLVYKNIPHWVKIISSILLPLFYNGPFCVHNILLLNNPDSDLGMLRYLLPDDKEDRLIASIFLGTAFTVPWLILAGLFGYHLPDTLLQQFYQNPFAKINPKLNISSQATQGLISLCSFALPLKFFLDVVEELFDSCEGVCTFFSIFVALSGVLFSLLPNLKIAELFIMFWNLFIPCDEKIYTETFEVFKARSLAAHFKDIQVVLSADEVDTISQGLNNQFPTMTERTALITYPHFQAGGESSYFLDQNNSNQDSSQLSFANKK